MLDISSPATIMRLEGLLFLGISMFVYLQLAAPWWLFVLFFFVPDISTFAYRYSDRVGMIMYNLAHTYLTPAVFLFAGLLEHYEGVVAMAIVWIAHIGFDRVCGRGLRAYSS